MPVSVEEIPEVIHRTQHAPARGGGLDPCRRGFDIVFDQLGRPIFDSNPSKPVA